MKSAYQVLIIPLSLLLISSCAEKQCGEDINTEHLTVNVEIERLEDAFFALNSAEEAIGFMDAYPVLAEAFYQRSQYPHDSVLVNKLLGLSSSPHLDTVRMEVDLLFGDLNDIRESFEEAFKRIKYHYPGFEPPKIQTIITGLGDGSDLYVSPDLIILGLDWFLGEGATFRPKDIPQYIRRRLNKAHLVSSCILFLSDSFNATNLENKTMLAEMVYFGKAYAFTREMLPCIPDSVLLGYSQEEIDGINYNQERIWAHFIEESLLYEANHFVKIKYLNERPNIPEIGDKCPGRIARWLGWQVIRKYREGTGTEFAALMKETDANKIFTQSKYRPDPR